jgi:hypothetical protein
MNLRGVKCFYPSVPQTPAPDFSSSAPLPSLDQLYMFCALLHLEP